MATQSLYRRYRPRRFSEVKGQDHVVRALRNSVAEGREGQAYLFSGPRGTGKTTSARILAKVLNCDRPVEGEPCCECDSCIAVERGTSFDVHELDAASNNGVEAMRDLIERASLGTPGRHKVYILDEVHMLSKPAEAALLKTLEEPPPHVVFVLATTDPQRVSETIRSRTQHLQFHLLPADTLAEHVRWVVDDAGLTVDEAAIDDVLALGGGSARDTLSALELIASAGGGRVESIPYDELVEAMIDRDPGRALSVVARAISLGRDPRTLTEELVGFLRNGFLSLMAPELVQLPSDRVDVVGDLARRLGAPGLVRGIEVLGSSLVEMRQAPDPRVLLDVAVVQLTAESVSADVSSLLTRLERLEQRIDDAVASRPGGRPAGGPPAGGDVDPATGRATLGGRARRRPATGEGVAEASADPAPARGAGPPEAGPPEVGPTGDEPVGAEPPAPVAPAAQAPSGRVTRDDWENAVRPQLRGMARAVYAPAGFVASTDTTVTLSLPNDAHRRKCEQQRPTVEAALSGHIGSAVTVELVIDGEEGAESGMSDASASGGSSAPGGPATGERGATDDERPRPPAGGPTSGAAGGAPAAPAEELPDDDDVDLDDLVDAPPDTVRTPIDRLAEAFPGSQLIDESA